MNSDDILSLFPSWWVTHVVNLSIYRKMYDERMMGQYISLISLATNTPSEVYTNPS